MQERSAMQRPLKECSAGALNEGALNAGALSEAAPSEGALSEAASSEGALSEASFSEGAFSEGAHHQRSAKEHLAKSCGSPRRCAVLRRQPRMEPRPRLSGEVKFEGTKEPHPAWEEEK